MQVQGPLRWPDSLVRGVEPRSGRLGAMMGPAGGPNGHFGRGGMGNRESGMGNGGSGGWQGLWSWSCELWEDGSSFVPDGDESALRVLSTGLLIRGVDAVGVCAQEQQSGGESGPCTSSPGSCACHVVTAAYVAQAHLVGRLSTETERKGKYTCVLGCLGATFALL